MARPKTSIVPDGDIESRARAVYGSGDVLFRIGNGGAGATGLLEVLANDYLSTLPEPRSIAWVCNHSRNSQLALYHDYVDLALTYERDQEALAESEGWSVTAACVFHDHFCLAGPRDDPADIRSSTSLADALFKIAQSQKLFHSRADGSATMWKERSLWSLAGLKPWENSPDGIWYKTSHVSPAEALQAADAAGAYLLTDRSTMLAQTRLKTVSNTTVFFEPQGPDDILMNSCYALLSRFSNSDRFKAAEAFVKYMLSPRGQNVIESYGRAQIGAPLFAAVHRGFATAKLALGAPKDGKWIERARL